MSRFFIHQEPVCRSQANYVIQIAIPGEPETPEFEQLWTSSQQDGSHIVCCIPFVLYGISLGDRIQKLSDGSFRILDPSGRIAIRVWMADSSAREKSDLIHKLAALECLMERSSENLLALDCRDADQAIRVRAILGQAARANKISYEMANPVEE
jgi:hypothetical protein